VKGKPVKTSERYRGKVERMLSNDKIIIKQTLESLNPGILDPFLPTYWEKNLNLFT